MLYSSLQKIIVLPALFLSLSACATDTKDQSDIRTPSQSALGKVTPADPSKLPDQIYLGAQVIVAGRADSKEAQDLTQAVNDQVEVFEPCRASIKDGLFWIEADWELSRQGQMAITQILKSVPDETAFKDCFLSHIKQLAFDPQPRALRGRMILEAYYGAPSGAGEVSGRRQ